VAAVSTMVITSLIAIGDKAIGGTLSASEGTHYLGKFNSFLESLSQERLMIYQVTTDSFPLVANTSTYSIGPGGTVNTDRPNRIVNAYVRDSANFDHELNVIDQASYWDIGSKAQTATYPSVVYYDNSFSATSTGTLHFAPVPSEVNTVYLNSWKQLTAVAHLSTNVLLPPGYQRMIESNFALEVSPGLVDPPAMLVKIARDSKAALKGVNAPVVISRMEAGAVLGASRGNILSGP
jgi:hypothetical protein